MVTASSMERLHDVFHLGLHVGSSQSRGILMGGRGGRARKHHQTVSVGHWLSEVLMQAIFSKHRFVGVGMVGRRRLSLNDIGVSGKMKYQ